MKERIVKNEERLNSALSSIKKLEDALNEFKSNKKNIDLLNKYYGSKDWFIDKENFELGKYKNLKAGVLSEDAVWNLNEQINELFERIEEIKTLHNNK